ncbi:hypothetical protein Q5P01_018101 [Channa striata]|uniref:Gap junction protein n=1 Tax=Channa striata TaxID=64152 RepID=A0AA88M3T8_CHASR|nr:hypothetical protein Q5P01_018101 [Channa striata]
MLVLGTAAESAWDDEQADFVCNTQQPGCTSVCYDKAFPISHFRYFVLQVIIVSTPTIFYFGYVAIKARNEKKQEEEKDEKQAEQGRRSKRSGIVNERDNRNVIEDHAEEKEEGCGRGGRSDKASDVPRLKGRLLCAYACSILLKVLLEVGFIVGLWFLYGGFFIEAKFECTKSPCPHTVDCFVSRPTEKTIFTIYTQVVAAISVLLNLLELLHLLQLAITHHLEKRYRTKQQDCLPRSEQVPSGKATPEQSEASRSYKAGSHFNFPMQAEATSYPNPCPFPFHGASKLWNKLISGSHLAPKRIPAA